MIADPLAADHEALSDALAGVIETLRAHRYGAPPSADSPRLETRVKELVRHLAEHMREEEDVLFPALLAVSPSSAPEIESLAQEHWPIHLAAREFAARFASGDEVGACETGRVFLAEFLAHVAHETRGICCILASAKGVTLNGTENLFFEWRVRSSAAELVPILEEWGATLHITEARSGVVKARLAVQNGGELEFRALQAQVVRFLRSRTPDAHRVEVQDAHPGRR